MESHRSKTSIPLAKGGSILFAKGSRVEIVCESGSLWLTEDNNIRDVVLEAGERFTFDGSGTVLAHALRPVKFTAVTSASRAAPAGATFSQRLFGPGSTVRRLFEAFDGAKPASPYTIG